MLHNSTRAMTVFQPEQNDIPETPTLPKCSSKNPSFTILNERINFHNSQPVCFVMYFWPRTKIYKMREIVETASISVFTHSGVHFLMILS